MMKVKISRSKTEKKENRRLLPQLKAPKRLETVKYFFDYSQGRKLSQNVNKKQIFNNSQLENKIKSDQNCSDSKVGKRSAKLSHKKFSNQCMTIQQILPCGYSAKKSVNSSNWIKCASDQYQGQRDYNEDRILLSVGIKILGKVFNFFGVFDGHGGSAASEYSKTNFIKLFEQQINAFPLLNILENLRKTINKLQNKICQLSKSKIGIGGTCASILITCQDTYYICHIGDSRILKIKNISSSCQFQQLTTDHKPQNERARIQSVGGKIYRSKTNIIQDIQIYGPYRIFPGKLSVSRTLGDYQAKKQPNGQALSWQPELLQGKIQQNSLFLIFSDGAYEKFQNNQIVQYFTKSKSMQQIQIRKSIQTFFINSILRQSVDNISLIAVFLKPNNM